MRRLIFALALAFAAPAAAQTEAPSPELTRAARALAAVWRPAPEPFTGEAISRACVGALDELATFEQSVPASLTPDALSRLRPPASLLVIPTEEPDAAFFFAPAGLDWFTNGLGVVSVISEADGFVGLRDAGGREIALQLGRAGRQAVLRVRPPEGDLLTFVGCAPIG